MCSNPISPYDNAYPSYLWPQVVAVLEAQGLPYLPSMAPILPQMTPSLPSIIPTAGIA